MCKCQDIPATLDIKNRNLEQLMKYAEWEKEKYPDDKNRTHVLDWAVAEIGRLRAELNSVTE